MSYIYALYSLSLYIYIYIGTHIYIYIYIIFISCYSHASTLWLDAAASLSGRLFGVPDPQSSLRFPVWRRQHIILRILISTLNIANIYFNVGILRVSISDVYFSVDMTIRNIGSRAPGQSAPSRSTTFDDIYHYYHLCLFTITIIIIIITIIFCYSPSPPIKSFPIKSPSVKLSGRPAIKFYGHENSHP